MAGKSGTPIPSESTEVREPAYMSREVVVARRFHLNLTPLRGPGLRVASGGVETAAPAYRIRRPGFQLIGLEFVAGGRGTVTLQGETYPIRAGALFCYGPGVAHAIESDPADPLVKYFVNVSGAEARRLLKAGPLRDGGVVHTAEPQRVLDLFDRLIEQGRSTGPHVERECALWAELLLLKVNETARLGTPGETAAFSTYRRCRAVAEERCAEVRTERELARVCHLDAAYLCRLFRRFAGESPYRFLVRLKMRRAAELLLEPEALVKNAGTAVGFPDPAHFSRVFKRVHGVAPQTFMRLGA
jgi:AraC-like DNA-binding protein